MKELKIAAPTGSDASFMDVATYAAKKAAVDSGVNVALGRLKPDEVIKQAGLDILLTTANIYGAKQIGRMYSAYNPNGTPKIGGPEINAVSHKIAHAMRGGVIGAAQGDALAGAIGGAVSESIMEFFKEDTNKICAQVALEAHQRGLDPDSEESASNFCMTALKDI